MVSCGTTVVVEETDNTGQDSDPEPEPEPDESEVSVELLSLSNTTVNGGPGVEVEYQVDNEIVSGDGAVRSPMIRVLVDGGEKSSKETAELQPGNVRSEKMYLTSLSPGEYEICVEVV